MSVAITYVFFHVGNDPTMAEMLVSSIRHSDPRASVEQLTDLRTSVINGVDRIHRFDVQHLPIMLARSIAYSRMPESDGMRVFIDTDMLLLRPISEKDFPLAADVFLCRRYFNRDQYVNVNFNNMAMLEYEGYTLDRAWPYLGCFLATRSSSVLATLSSFVSELPTKYQQWYGDQIALKYLASLPRLAVQEISELNYAHLVNANVNEYEGQLAASEIKLLHFKGTRKRFMRDYYDSILAGRLSLPL
jgi:hypothetical protein